MNATMAARRLLVLVCAVGLLAAASPVLADDDDGYLGVVLQDISPSMAKALQLDDENGVLVSEIVDDSPAAKAGLEDGDVILEFEGKELGDYGDLTKAVRKSKPGQEVELVVLREGKKKTVKVELGERDDDVVWVSDDDVHFGKTIDIESLGDRHRMIIDRIGDDDDIKVFLGGMNEDRGFLGVHLDDLGEQLGEHFGVEDGEGALVTEVGEDSPAAEAGLKAGDVIVKLNGDDIESVSELHEAMADTEVEQKIKVEVKRKGKDKSFDVTLGELPEDAFVHQMKVIGDGGHFPGMAPKMMHRMPRMQKHRFHGDGAERIEIIRELELEAGELDEMRKELDKMRDDLDEMRKELKK